MDQIVSRPKAAAAPPVEPLPDVAPAPARRRSRRLIYALAAVTLAAAGGYYALAGGSAPQVSYASVPVERGDIAVQVSATGTLQPLIQVDISSELSGVVRAVNVEENQRVARGDVLAELDTVRIAAQVERAEASAKVAEARVAEARTTLAETEQALSRTTQLSQRGMAANQALETATAARDRAAANVAVAEANLAIAAAELKLQQADLQKSRIYAPIDGIVLTRSVNPGQTVASSMQAPVLFVIAAELENMELEAAVDEADIGGVQAGQKATFTVDAFPDRRFEATIGEISFASVATEGVVTYNARLDVDNRELLLRPGMTATVAILTREANGVLTVPSAAFRFSPRATEQRSFTLRDLFGPPRMGRPGGQRARRGAEDGTRTLYVLRNGAPEAVQVRTGVTDGENTEILSGLAEGDRVVTGVSQPRG